MSRRACYTDETIQLPDHCPFSQKICYRNCALRINDDVHFKGCSIKMIAESLGSISNEGINIYKED